MDTNDETNFGDFENSTFRNLHTTLINETMNDTTLRGRELFLKRKFQIVFFLISDIDSTLTMNFMTVYTVENNCLKAACNDKSILKSQTIESNNSISIELNPVVRMAEDVRNSFIVEMKNSMKDYAKHEEQFNVFISKHIDNKNNDIELLKAKYREGLEKLKKINALIKLKREQVKNDENEMKQNISKVKDGKYKIAKIC